MAVSSSFSKSTSTSSDNSMRNLATARSYTFIIPDDILFNIVQLMVQDESYYERNSERYPSFALYPWTLAAVCKRWRAVCLHGAILWSHIALFGCAQHIFNQYSKTLLLRSCLQLERSRDAPLTIYATFSSLCESQLLRWKFDLPHLQRCKKLRLRIGVGQMSYYFHDIDAVANSTMFANIERLHLLVLDHDDEEKITAPFPAEWSSLFVKLRSVSLVQIDALKAESVGLPWHRLTSLALEHYAGDLSSPILALSQCNSLIHFSFSVARMGWDAVDESHWQTIDAIASMIPKDSVIVPDLASLHLADLAVPEEKRILPFLRLPSLRYLGFGSINRDFCADTEYTQAVNDPEPSDILIDLIERSGCVLAELGLQYERYHTETYHMPIASALRMMPHLRYMRVEVISHCNLAYDLQWILYGVDNEYLCPSLEHLILDWSESVHVHVVEGMDPNFEAFRDALALVKVRLDSPSISHIKVLEFALCEDSGENVRAMAEEMLEENIEDGLVLRFIEYQRWMLDLPRIH